MNEDEFSNSIWIMKALLILSVICAHTNFEAVNTPLFYALLSRLGSVGVPAFLIIAAYYFNPRKYESLFSLAKKKVKSIVVPWFFSGTVVCIITFIRTNHKISLFSVLSFLLGYNSYLYYLSVLSVLFFVFWLFKNTSPIVMLCLCFIINIVSHILTVLGVVPAVLKSIGLTNYLNPFNWCFFFSLGRYLRSIKIAVLVQKSRELLFLFSLLWVALFVFGLLVEPTSFGYFSIIGPAIELVSIVIIFNVAYSLRKNEILVTIGKCSFSIYLFHFLLIPVIYKFFGNSIIGAIIMPVLTYLLSLFLLYICKCVSTKLKIYGWISTLIGMR